MPSDVRDARVWLIRNQLRRKNARSASAPSPRSQAWGGGYFGKKGKEIKFAESREIRGLQTEKVPPNRKRELWQK